jgi:DNA-binding LacI/PurR family transcriptional regulator
MIDVAKRAGVSVATVSNYLTGKKTVGKEKAEAVEKAIEELHYEVNIMARGLKSNKSYAIGVIVPNVTSVYFMQMFNGLRDAAEGTGYTFSFLSSDFDFKKEKKAVRSLRNGRVEGIIINSFCRLKDRKKWAEELSRPRSGQGAESPFPIVSLEYDLGCDRVSAIVIENRKLSRECTEYLISKGKKRILYISAQQESIVGSERLSGYREALKNAGIEEDPALILEGDLSSDSGYQRTIEAMDKGLAFDAVQAVNDQSAVGALKALSSRGVKIPDDVCLLGCDNVFPSTLVTPQITTVDIPAYAIGMRGFEIIKMMIETPDFEPVKETIEHRFIERKSTNKRCSSEWSLARW